jgi:hypothetical protein
MPPDLQPIVFTDALGRDWYPVIDDQAVAELLRFGAIDLAAAVKGSAPELADLWGGHPRLSLFLLLVSYRQAGWSRETALGEAGRCWRVEGIPPHDGPTSARAIECLVWAVRRRFPQSLAVCALAWALPRWRRFMQTNPHWDEQFAALRDYRPA